LNKRNSSLVGALSRALGNTLVSAEEQDGKLHLALLYLPPKDEWAEIRRFVRLYAPSRRITRRSRQRTIIID
jgi:hypothetical protein